MGRDDDLSTTDDNDDKMGVDLDRHHVSNGHRKAPHSDNPYLKLLHKLFSSWPAVRTRSSTRPSSAVCACRRPTVPRSRCPRSALWLARSPMTTVSMRCQR